MGNGVDQDRQRREVDKQGLSFKASHEFSNQQVHTTPTGTFEGPAQATYLLKNG